MPACSPSRCECSSGTYIRTLAADIGAALGGGAHLRNLRRTAIGSFGVDDAVALDVLGPDDVLSPADALRDYAAVMVDDATVIDIGHGKTVDGLGDGAPTAALAPDGRLLAVYKDGRPEVVLPPQAP